MKGGVYKAGDEAEATLIGTMSGQPGLYKYYNGEYRDNYRDVTAGRVLEGESAYMAGSEKDVVFTYGASGEYKRNVDQFTLADTLPTYTDAAGVLRYAEFIAANNPGWTVVEWDADGDAATSDPVAADPGGAGVPSKLSYTGSPGVVHLLSATILPKLKLRFPLARVPQSVTNSACLATTVNNREDQSAAPYAAQVDPEGFNACDPVSLTLTGTSTRGMYSKSSAGPHEISGYYFFYDDPVEKAAVFSWGLNLSNTLEEPLSNITYVDRDLDSRMYYYGVRNPLAAPAAGRTQTYDAQVVAYDSGGNVLLDETVTESQYVFPADLGSGKTPRDIDHIEVRIIDYTLPVGSSAGISVLTKLRDTTVTYESESTGIGITFRNESDCAFTYTDANGTRQYQVSGANETHIKDPNNRLSIGKESQIVGNKPILSGGEYIDYTLYLGGERTPGAYPEDFIVVDLLPKEVEFVSFTPSTMLADSIGYSYQVVGDYQGTGQSAVIIQADRVKLTATGEFTGALLGTIRVQFGYFVYDKVRAGFENDVYMSAATDTDAEFTLQGTVADPFDTKLNGGDPISHAQAGNDALVAMTFELWKQVRSVNLEQPELSGAFSSSGVGAKASEAGKPSLLEYKLNIYNNTEVAHQDFVLYDIFPFVGDKLYDKTISGADKPRLSEFRNTLYCLPDPGPGWSVYITRDVTAVNSRAWVSDPSHWTLYDTSVSCPDATLADVRGIKLVSDSTVVLAEGEGFDYTFQVLSPQDPDGSLIGGRAYNSFGEQDNLNPDPLESNAAYNQVLPPTGAIIIKKVNLEGDGLSGAELELVDLATNTRVGGIKVSRTDDPNTLEDETGLVTWTNVPVGNYAVREVTAPEGYEKTVAEITVRLEDLLAMGDGYVYDVTNTDPLENSPLPPEPEKATITVAKVDASGQALAGASFTIVGVDDGTVEGYPDNTSITYRRVTNKSGYAVFDDLPLGHYRVTETAPPGHLMNNWAGETVALDVDGANVLVGPIANSKAEFTLVKIGIFDQTYIAKPNIELDASMGKRLAGVPFALYDATQYAAYLADEASSPGSGTLPTPVASGVTNAQGEISFAQLDPNKHYTLVEDVADPDVTGPGGTSDPLYVGRGSGDDKNLYDVFISLTGDLLLDGLKIGTKNLVIGNNGQSTVFRAAIAKVDQNGNPVPGVVFRLATTNSVTGTGVDLTTDAAGLIEITEASLNALPASAGKTALLNAYSANSAMYVIEKSVPSGYAIPSGQASWAVYKDSGYQARTFTNWKTSLELYKYTVVALTTDATLAYLGVSQSLTGTALDAAIAEKLAEDPSLTITTIGGEKVLRKGVAGAEFRVAQTTPACALTDANKFNPATGAGCWFTATSDATGHIKAPDGFKFISSYTYTVVETKAPKGYKLDATAQTFSPDTAKGMAGFDGTVHLTLANEPELGQVRITKLAKQGGKVLEGVVFALYDTDENKVAERTTDRNGNAVFNSLPYGTYTFKEIETIEGFRLLNQTWTAVVGPDSKSVSYVIYNEETEKLSSLQVTKKDDEGVILKGVRFYLQTWVSAGFNLDSTDDDVWADYTVNDNWGISSRAQPRQTDPNGVVTFGQLPKGIYRLVESTVNAKYRAALCEEPGGLKPLAECTFTVNPGFETTFTLTVVNPIVDTPSIADEVKDAAGGGWSMHDADLQKSYAMAKPDEEVPWFDYLDMGCRTDKWSKAELVDDLDDRLAPITAAKVAVYDEGGNQLTQGVDYTVSVQSDPEQADYNKVVVTFLPKGTGANELEWLECHQYTVRIDTKLREDLIDREGHPDTAFGADYQDMVDQSEDNHDNHIKHRPEFNYADPDVVSDGDPGKVTGLWVEAYPPAQPYLVPSKSSDPADGSRVLAGGTVTYTLTFANTLGTAAAEVDYLDLLAGVLDATAMPTNITAQSGLDAIYLPGPKVLRVTGVVPAGGTLKVTFKVKVNADGTRSDNSLDNWLVPTPTAPCDPREPGCTDTPPADCDVDDPADDDCLPDVPAGCTAGEPCVPDEPPTPPSSCPVSGPGSELCTVHYVPELVPSKSSDPADGSKVLPGDTVTYTLTFDNSKGEAAADVEYLDLLPGVLDAAAGPTNTSTAPGLTVMYSSSSKIMRVVGSVPAGQTRQVTFKVKVSIDGARTDNSLDNWLVPTPVWSCDPADPDCDNPNGLADGCSAADEPGCWAPNGYDPADPDTWVLPAGCSAGVPCVPSYPPPIPESCPVSGTGSELCTVHYVPELIPSKSSDPADGSKVLPGDTVTYTLTFDNSKGEASADVEFLDLLAGVLDATTAPTDITADFGLTATYLSGSKTIHVVGSVAAGETLKVTFKVKVLADGSRSDNSLDNWLVPTPTAPCDPREPGCTDTPPADCDVDDPADDDCLPDVPSGCTAGEPCVPDEPPTPPSSCPVSGPSSELCTVHYVPELAPSKSASPADGSRVLADGTVAYTLVFDNSKGEAAADVDFLDLLAGVLDATAVPTDITPDSGLAALYLSGAKVLHVWGSVPAGETLKVTFKVKVSADGSRSDNSLDNWLVPTPTAPCDPRESGCTDVPPADCDVDDPNDDDCLPDVPSGCTAGEPCVPDEPPTPPGSCPSEGAGAELCTVHYVPELVPSKSSDPADGSKVLPGDTVTYTLTFSNVDGEATADVDFLDLLAGVLDATAAPTDITADSGLTATYLSGSKTIHVVGSVPVGETLKVTFNVKVSADGTRTDNSLDNWLVPTSSVPCDPSANGCPDEPPTPPSSCPSEGPGAELCTVHYVPELEVIKTSDPAPGTELTAGQAVTYTLTFSNETGKASASVDWLDALAKVLDDADMEGELVVPAGWTGVFHEPSQSVHIVGEVPAGESLTVVYRVKVKADGSRGDDALDNWVLLTSTVATACGSGESCLPTVPPETAAVCPLGLSLCTAHRVSSPEPTILDPTPVATTTPVATPTLKATQSPSPTAPSSTEPPDDDNGDLAFTGSDLAGIGVLASLFVLAGASLLVGRRRKWRE
ncbi:MAG: DUF11 domain-containing protein [Propionibacteriaceae bacterium]|nr:DUF11 domain-containing protein [Propionibacteriaceae bacterium]